MKTIMNHSMNDPREPGVFTPIYECPQCGENYTDPADLKWYTFTDGEKRKQCYMCDFHPDEEIKKIEPIDELDFQNN